MEELKLHSFGQNDHLESLKKKYKALKQNISESKVLSETEKKSELSKLDKSFKKEVKDSENSLY